MAVYGRIADQVDGWPGDAVTETPVTFAGFLRKLRTDAGLTQEELAEAAGVSVRSVSDLERGITRTARKDTARRLADALGLSGAARAEFEAVARGRSQAFAQAAGAATGGAEAARRTLPRDISSFTGREPELRALADAAAGPACSGGVVGIHAIGGMAGIGKTAFAVQRPDPALRAAASSDVAGLILARRTECDPGRPLHGDRARTWPARRKSRLTPIYGGLVIGIP